VRDKIESLPTLASGVYTPTLTNTANLDASTAFECRYMRLGNIVIVSGKVDVDPTAANTSTTLRMTLPVASNLAAIDDLSGTANARIAATHREGVFAADSTNDAAELFIYPAQTANKALYFQFCYQVE
jgi:hypothetical protein